VLPTHPVPKEKPAGTDLTNRNRIIQTQYVVIA